MKYLCILFLLLFPFSVFGNNIRVEGKTRVVEFTGDTAVVEVTLLWDNSWRDDFNWDGAWVFFKYKKREGVNGWHPVRLSSSGHEATPLSGNEGGGYTFMVGASGSHVMGVYVLREDISEGNVKVRLRVKWPLSGSGLTESDFGEDYRGIYVAVHAMEMVYIPYGAYSLGDGFSGNSFVGSGKQPLTIDSEDARSVYTLSSPSTAFNLPSSYPKGYAGFYVMKYEVSQEQYVEFLNSLTLSQQKERVGNNDFEHMEKGDYVFGDLKSPNCRNGIAFISLPGKGGPAVFGNNLNPGNEFFSVDDGQTLACNYMSVEDMLSYCSWSGLRPMSELEYEKVCRRPYPQVPEKGEYAWNTASGVNALQSESELSYRWSENEQALSKQRNVNSGGKINGPVRCGLFATSSTSQLEAGATYWGVMEMGGNVKELCVNVSYVSFDGSSVGFGEYNPGLWNASFSNYGVRGGGFSSHDAQLRTSDRSEAEGYFSSSSHRDSTVGFRGVRLVREPVNPGSLIVKKEDGSAMSYGCLGFTSHIESATAASVGVSGMNFTYLWYVLEPGSSSWKLLSGETKETLDYDRFFNNGTGNVTYQFKRKAICQVGEATSAVLSLTVPNTQIKVTPPLVYLDGANAASSVITATSTQTGGTFSWVYNNTAISDGTNIVPSTGKSIYRPSRTHFGDKKLVEGEKSVICRYTIGECTMDSVVVVEVAPYDTDACTGTVTDVEGHSYAITKIGDQCWMQDNMNIGTMSEINGESSYWRHKDVGIQKFCNGSTSNGGKTSNSANCDKYGGLYEWWEVVCAGYCAGLTTPDMDIKQGDYASMEQAAHAAVPAIVMSPDGYHIKGFCPDGWHLPSDEEWKQLEMYLGMSRVHADLAYDKGNMDGGWGRGDGSPAQGTMMKSTEDSSNGLSTRTNSDDKYCFYGRLHGCRTSGGGGFNFLYANFFGWSSTSSGAGAWVRQLYKGYTSVCRNVNHRSSGFSVRCVRD